MLNVKDCPMTAELAGNRFVCVSDHTRENPKHQMVNVKLLDGLRYYEPAPDPVVQFAILFGIFAYLTLVGLILFLIVRNTL